MSLKYVSLLLVCGVVVLCVITGIMSVYILGPDNKVTEISENIIEQETGLKLDFEKFVDNE